MGIPNAISRDELSELVENSRRAIANHVEGRPDGTTVTDALLTAIAIDLHKIASILAVTFSEELGEINDRLIQCHFEEVLARSLTKE